MSERPRHYQTYFEAQEAAKRNRRDELIDEMLRIGHGVTPPPVRRGPGRPPWTAELFHNRYRDARDRCAEGATDKELADAMHVSAQWFGRLVRRFGRPV